MDSRPAGETLARFPKYSQTTRSAQPVKAMQSRGTARRRWTTSLLYCWRCCGDVSLKLWCQRIFHRNSRSVSESFIETLDQRKTSYCTIVHWSMTTVPLSTPQCKGHDCIQQWLSVLLEQSMILLPTNGERGSSISDTKFLVNCSNEIFNYSQRA